MSTIHPGSVVTLEITSPFAGLDGVASDPDIVTFSIWQHGYEDDAQVFTFGEDDEVVKDGTGDYHVDYLIPYERASVGWWKFEVRGSGGVTAVRHKTFRVTAPHAWPVLIAGS